MTKEKKTIFITGATQGMGLLTANIFDSKNWNVVATGRSSEKLAKWQAEHPNQMTVTMDVTDERAVKEAIGSALRRFGKIDVIVNNAGYGLYGPLEGYSAKELEDQFRTNVFGTVNVIRQALPSMREHKGGTIINVTSVGARTTAPFMSAYSGSKFAVEGLSESLYYELLEHNIRVKIVEPGHFNTRFLSGLTESTHPAYYRAYKNHMSWVIAGGKKAPTAEPVARAIYKAATDSSRKLRYPVRGALMLWSSKWLPWVVWSTLAMTSMKRARTK